MSDVEGIVERLRDAVFSENPGEPLDADVCAALCEQAADEIERLNAALQYEQHRSGRIGTHGVGCWAWGPQHYECALSELQSRDATISRLEGERDRFEYLLAGSRRAHDDDLIARETRREAAEARAQKAEAALGEAVKVVEPFSDACDMFRFAPPRVRWETEAGGLVYAVDREGYKTEKFTYRTLSAKALEAARTFLSKQEGGK